MHEALPRLRQALLEGGGLGEALEGSATLDLTKRGKIKSLLVRWIRGSMVRGAEDRRVRTCGQNIDYLNALQWPAGV